MAGPPPKNPSERRRRNATPGFEQLDPNGRVARIPDWPFPPATREELNKWAQLWRLPQSVKWDEMNSHDMVALYVRSLMAALKDVTDTKLMNEVRQLDNKLGISPLAMRNMRWEIAPRKEDELAAANGNGKAREPYVPA